jgi:intracellular multiplication protein IcmM
MARMPYDEMVAQKGYYQQRLRKGAALLMFSLALMAGLIVVIYLVFISRAEPDYYATTSASQILQLRALAQPNRSAQALLKPDPPEELSTKSLGVLGD